MYKLSVPLTVGELNDYGAESFINALKEQGAETAVLSIGCYQMDRDKQEKTFADLKKYVPLFKEAGFTVAVWLWTFAIREEAPFTRITSPSGKVSAEECCPSDKAFCQFVYTYLQNIAKSGTDLILFDDDFRYGFIDCGLGCACKNHRAFMQSLLGEALAEGDISQLIFAGSKNKYRSAFLKANGHFFKEFAKMSRRAVDSVDPTIRLGLCACMTTWDFDGVSAAELSRILAGNTKPFLRLIGAPYWAFNRGWGNRLQDVIELERMESSWCGEGIEILAEGDTYPRPRFTCSANELEGFDMALRASGAVDGILKYMLDYYADVDYEKGYRQKHLQNKAVYAQIDAHFGGKTPVGVRIHETMQKFENADVPAYYAGKDEVENLFFSPAARMLAAQAIPSVYEGLGVVGIAFGENAKYIDQDALKGGMILDITAAQILENAGVDVGLAKVGEVYKASREYFSRQHRYFALLGCPATEIEVKDGACIESTLTDLKKETVGSYTYQNAQGQHFLVFAFDGYSMNEHAFKHYVRGEQIERWICSIGKALPASMLGNPDCYMLCKENEAGKAVWIGNFFADECMQRVVTLDRSYKRIEFINCSGKLDGNKVILDAVLPYASVGFAVYD
ncbi:MAG: hypothetical protein J6R40_05335 [Clostridia bacterium]|nr:hypothetical protein [Clostridia bacterium]